MQVIKRRVNVSCAVVCARCPVLSSFWIISHHHAITMWVSSDNISGDYLGVVTLAQIVARISTSYLILPTKLVCVLSLAHSSRLYDLFKAMPKRRGKRGEGHKEASQQQQALVYIFPFCISMSWLKLCCSKYTKLFLVLFKIVN